MLPWDAAASTPGYLAPDAAAPSRPSGAPDAPQGLLSPVYGGYRNPGLSDEEKSRRDLAYAERAHAFSRWFFGPASAPQQGRTATPTQATWPAAPSGDDASYPGTPTYASLGGSAETAATNPDALPPAATPFVDRWAEPSDFRRQPPSYLSPIPKAPPAIASMPSLTRSQRRSEFVYPHFPVGLGNDPGTNGEGWFAQNSPDPSLFDRTPTWLRDSMAVPPSRHPTPALDSASLQQSELDMNDLVNRVIYAESGGDTYAPGVGSSALGAGQFIAKTWVDEIKNHLPELIKENPWLDPSIRQHPENLTVKDAAAAGLLNARTNYALARRGTADLAKENAAQLTVARLPVTARNLYLAHFFGAKDAINVLNAEPTTPAEQIVSPASAHANASVVHGNDVQRLLSLIDRKMTAARPDLLPFR
jgi:hypothetical protein